MLTGISQITSSLKTGWPSIICMSIHQVICWANIGLPENVIVDVPYSKQCNTLCEYKALKHHFVTDYEKPCGRIQDEARYHIEPPRIYKPSDDPSNHEVIVQKTESVKTPTNSNSPSGNDDGSHSSLPKSRTRKEEESMGINSHSLTESSSAAAASSSCAKNVVWVLFTASMLAWIASHRHLDTAVVDIVLAGWR